MKKKYLMLLTIILIFSSGCSYISSAVGYLGKVFPVRITVELLGKPLAVPNNPGAVQVLSQGNFDKTKPGLETVWLICPPGQADKCNKGEGKKVTVVDPSLITDGAINTDKTKAVEKSMALNINTTFYPTYRAQKVN